MPIATAIQRGSALYAYDEKNRLLFTKSIGAGPKDGLTGYTGGSLSLRWGGAVYTYDDRGRLISTRSV